MPPLLPSRAMMKFPAAASRLARVALALAAGVFLPLLGRGQSSVRWTTNYYSVTGTDFRAIRASIAKARPWKENFDAETRWRVEWRFNVAARDGGCVCTGFSTTTAIVTTLPAWTPPVDATPDTREQWARFFQGLVQHEAGHARNGTNAAAAIEKEFGRAGPPTDCDALKKILNDRADRVIADYRRRDEEYDRSTAYGSKPAKKR
ncbi:MAG: DUF922 domain-containing protein [Verrucomicrobia bacterium]|nr:DUF922 domain-containing protein [Verrucomicrobiota bacterium]